ncbi:MAG TPA: branched-chain amino acid ABC transporter permease [Candidatus Sulfotelmatobacter sp.]|nr:branched-chain amino acid ABC transporter permease [Candidatus Sulfotelmatobacter sp.]
MAEFLQQVINGLLMGGVYALVAVGFALIFGVLRVLYMTHGEVLMLAAYIGLFAVTLTNSLVIAMLAAMASAAIVGMLIERIAVRPLRGQHHLMPLVTTISVGLILQEVIRITVHGGEPVAYPRQVRLALSPISLGPLTIGSAQVLVLIVSVVLMIALTYFIRRTKAGRAIRAVAQDFDVAAMLGVSIDRVSALTFAVSSALTGAAGVLFGVLFSSITPYIGGGIGFKALAIVLFGGLGSLPGAVVGGLILGLVESLAVGYLATTYRDAFAFATMILILLVRPSGLFGTHIKLD